MKCFPCFDKAIWRYAFYGACFGCCFPIIATAIGIWQSGGPWSFAQWVRVQQTSPLQ